MVGSTERDWKDEKDGCEAERGCRSLVVLVHGDGSLPTVFRARGAAGTFRIKLIRIFGRADINDRSLFLWGKLTEASKLAPRRDLSLRFLYHRAWGENHFRAAGHPTPVSVVTLGHAVSFGHVDH